MILGIWMELIYEKIVEIRKVLLHGIIDDM